MEKFKIFYSWQSDLPGNKTRNFIRECIDEAIDLAQESEAVEAERDEATTGMTGSPNIVTTLFSKIDNCDLFIADLSLCFTEDQKRRKRSPNPNVMLELGYAVKALGWERVICLCNTDFGNEYPFDIEHIRITDFSLEDKSKKEVKADIAKIIFINIRDIRKQVPRAKQGRATHIVGTYDFSSKKVITELMPIEIRKQESYMLHNEVLLDEAKELIAEIERLTNQITIAQKAAIEPPVELSAKSVLPDTQQSHLSGMIHLMGESYKASETPVVWSDEEDDCERIKRWLGINVPEDFFALGGLKKTVQLFNLQDPILNGTDNEKQKYDMLQTLSYKLTSLDVRENYLKTFDGMYFIPLAIQNISSMQDADIDVLVNVEIGKVIEPDEHLIWPDYEGLQGIICKDDEDQEDVGIICELFGLTEDGVIHTEVLPYDPSKYIPKMPIITIHGLSQPEKTEEDYKNELEDFIASTGGNGYYEFNISNLRPGECKWLCCGMLIKPVESKVKVRYQIYSKNSLGDLSGVLEVKSD